ncbi:rubredoxin [Xanthomonas sacchari]
MRRRRWDNAVPTVTCDYPMSDASATTYRTWMCVVCGFIYNEADGLPEEGIDPGTRWDDVPDTWTCPDCGVTKDDFEMVEME